MRDLLDYGHLQAVDDLLIGAVLGAVVQGQGSFSTDLTVSGDTTAGRTDTGVFVVRKLVQACGVPAYGRGLAGDLVDVRARAVEQVQGEQEAVDVALGV